MSAIWRDTGDGWKIVSPVGFPDEATLHGLVERAPGMLPLAGSPSLVVLGREVQLGSGYADLLAVETTGRFVVIEVKLRTNSESRRAIVTQVLTYGSSLWGMTVEDLENGPLARALAASGAKTVAGAVQAADQSSSMDLEAFAANLAENLRVGAFRLVLVLDEAPPELAGLIAYLGVIH
jgi:hypothetical protein